MSSLERLKKVLGDDIKKYEQKMCGFKEQYVNHMNRVTQAEYQKNPEVTDVVFPRSPFIDSRIYIVKGEQDVQKFDVLQTFGGGSFTAIDVVSIPEEYHKDIKHKYVAHFIGQPPIYFATGGYIEFQGDNKIKLYGKSQDFGASVAGYDVNTVAKELIGLTGKFKEIDAEPNSGLETNIEKFFDGWLDLFEQKLDNYEFAKSASNIYLDKADVDNSDTMMDALMIRAINKVEEPFTDVDLMMALTNEMRVMTNEKLKQAFQKNMRDRND